MPSLCLQCLTNKGNSQKTSKGCFFLIHLDFNAHRGAELGPWRGSGIEVVGIAELESSILLFWLIKYYERNFLHFRSKFKKFLRLIFFCVSTDLHFTNCLFDLNWKNIRIVIVRNFFFTHLYFHVHSEDLEKEVVWSSSLESSFSPYRSFFFWSSSLLLRDDFRQCCYVRCSRRDFPRRLEDRRSRLRNLLPLLMTDERNFLFVVMALRNETPLSF